jgi:tRNA-specific 2-thiouridylase
MLDAEHISLTASKRTVVAMSGGVDSCVAAILLKQAGYDIVGISMQVWDYKRNGGSASRATCCAPSDFDDARSIAESIGFPFYVFDFEETFKREVIDRFVSSYLAGQTPNPCLDCNRRVKFHELRQRAGLLGYPAVATGHYARIRPKVEGNLGLYTARDVTKDQSYFLYELTQQDLRTTLFPVGDILKSEAREILLRNGYSIASKPESQDICFVGDTAGKFVERQSGVKPPAGKILLTDGTIVGEHEGIHQFTVGQRRGLRVSSEHPLYVVSIDEGLNAVTLGQRHELERKGFYVHAASWVGGMPTKWPLTVKAKLRYRHEGVLCKVSPDSIKDTSLFVEFIDEWSPVSPGQAAVFYSPETEIDGAVEVYGGGRIEKRSS